MSDRPLSPRQPWEGRRVVLGVTGGIAAYKSVQLARDLTRMGSGVDVVLTRSAMEFVGALTFEGVTGRRVHTEVLSTDGSALHIRLASEADLVLVAPATADVTARAAQGRADDLLTTILLATRAPVLLAPAMNDRMYSHPQTLRNIDHCSTTLGYRFLGPDSGALAFGEGEGRGRMLEPAVLLEHVGCALGRDPRFRGRTVLVTAGPTREPIDPVRFVGNRSSGRMGFALAREAWLRGADVTLVTGPSELPDPTGVATSRVETAMEMLAEVEKHVASADYLFFAAAVSDFRPSNPRTEKVKRAEQGSSLSLKLVENPDIARETIALRKSGAIAVGFALETHHLHEGAKRKLEEKGFHLVVANDPTDEGAGFDVSTNRVAVLDAGGGVEELPLQSKDEVAARILDRAGDVSRPGRRKEER